MSYQDIYTDPSVIAARTIGIADYPVLYSGVDKMIIEIREYRLVIFDLSGKEIVINLHL